MRAKSFDVKDAMGVRRGSQKSETANRGDTGRSRTSRQGTGLGGWRLPLIQLASFEAGDAQLATVLEDNGSNALD